MTKQQSADTATQSGEWSGESAGMEHKEALTPRLVRILSWMGNGDHLFEVAGRTWWTVFDERLGRERRVQAAEVTELVRLGMIEKMANPFAQRLDAWDLTPQGQEVAKQAQPKRLRARRQTITEI